MATNKMIRNEADVAGSFGKWLKNTFEKLLLIYNYYCCYSPLSCKWADTVKLSSSVAVSLLICFVLLVLGDTWQMRREKLFYNWEALFVAGQSLQSCRVDVWKCVNFMFCNMYLPKYWNVRKVLGVDMCWKPACYDFC